MMNQREVSARFDHTVKTNELRPGWPLDPLETKSLPYEAVVEGAKAQLGWVLKELWEG